MTTHLLQVFDNPLDPEIRPVSFASEGVNGDLSVTRDLSVGRDAAITRNETVGGTLQVTGAVTLSAALGVGGNINAGQSVFASTGVVHGKALTSGEDCTVGRDLTVARNVQVNGNAAVVGALQATTFGVGAIATPRGTRAAIPDLPAFTDPPTAGEMATLRTTINTLLSYLRVTPGNGMIED